MKKIFFFVFIFTSTALSASLASCASPQGTVASQATATFPPPTSTPKQTEMAEFNRQARFEGDDPRFLVGGGESPGRPVSLPQDVLAFLRNNHEGPIINGDNFIARVSADGVCSVFTTDHLVDSGAVLSEVNDGRVVFSVDGTATVGQFRFPVPDGVACVASLAQEGSGFAPGTILVRFFRDNGKAGAQILNEEPIRPLVNAPNRIELVELESGFQLVTTGADGQEIEKQTVDTKGWAETIKEFSVCLPENFRDCKISVEDLFNGNYHRWLETLSQPFDQSKLKDVPFWNLGGLILYDEKTAPNFDDPSTAPFRRDVTIGTVFLEIEGVRYPYIVKPIEFFDKNEPEKNKWVITVDPFGNIETGPDSDDIMYRWGIKIWQEEMNVTPILTNAISASSDLEDPLVKQTFDNNPDMRERFDRFILGDVSALSEPGIVLLTTDGIHEMFR